MTHEFAESRAALTQHLGSASAHFAGLRAISTRSMSGWPNRPVSNISTPRSPTVRTWSAASCVHLPVRREKPGLSLASAACLAGLAPVDRAPVQPVEIMEASATSQLTGLSVILITKNEAHNLAACLKSVDFADEIIVVDSCSQDGTLEIAEAAGARVVIFLIPARFGPQKSCPGSGDPALGVFD